MSRGEASAPKPEPKMPVGPPTVEMIRPNWSTQEPANNSIVNLSWLDLMTLVSFVLEYIKIVSTFRKTQN